MKKIGLFIIAIFIYYGGIAQKNNICGKLHYTLTVDIGFGILEKTDYLMQFNDNASYSEEINITASKGINKIKSKASQRRNIIVPERTNTTPRFFYNTIDEFFYKIILSNESVIVKDDKNDWNWKILTDTKTIQGYTCKKATIDFRGKSYIAWFTDKIVVPFGPWKLQKLPGLILEIQSTDKSVQVKTTKIETTQDANCKIDFDKKQLDKALTIPELYKKREEIFKAIDLKMKNEYKMSKAVEEECKECPKGLEKYDTKK